MKTIDGEEFSDGATDSKCPVCNGRTWLVVREPRFFQTVLVNKIHEGMDYLTECLGCKNLIPQN